MRRTPAAEKSFPGYTLPYPENEMTRGQKWVHLGWVYAMVVKVWYFVAYPSRVRTITVGILIQK